jgi:hypothetical protein
MDTKSRRWSVERLVALAAIAVGLQLRLGLLGGGEPAVGPPAE